MSRTCVPMSTLPAGIQRALVARVEHLGVRMPPYRGKDVYVETRDAVSLGYAGGSGTRGYAAIVQDVDSGKTVTSYYGSWGGPSAFSAHYNPVDNILGAPYAVPPAGAIVTAVSKLTPTVYLRPITYVRILALAGSASADALAVADDMATEGRQDKVDVLVSMAMGQLPTHDLTELDRRVLYCYGALKSGHYRQDALKLIADGASWRGQTGVGEPAMSACVASLLARGYLRRAANGATQITTKGKAARSDRSGSGEVW